MSDIDVVSELFHEDGLMPGGFYHMDKVVCFSLTFQMVILNLSCFFSLSPQMCGFVAHTRQEDVSVVQTTRLSEKGTNQVQV